MKNDKSKDKSSELPAPELLKPQIDNDSSENEISESKTKSTKKLLKRYATYRPSHKATFMGLGAVAVILIINVVVVFIVIKNQDSNTTTGNKSSVTISSEALSGLGVNKSAASNSDAELTVNPNAVFKGTVTIGKNTSIAGDLNLSGTLSASSSKFTNFQAGEALVESLNVNQDATISNLNLRKDLTVVGMTKLQGAVTMSQLVTINNSVNITGNVAIGGTLSVRNFQANNLTSDTTLTIGGHIITRGYAPSVSGGSAINPSGTVSISGNDASGTIYAGMGYTASVRSGMIANVSFNQTYSNIPHVVITSIGCSVNAYLISRSTSGFIIGSTNIPAGAHSCYFDYIVMQ